MREPVFRRGGTGLAVAAPGVLSFALVLLAVSAMAEEPPREAAEPPPGFVEAAIDAAAEPEPDTESSAEPEAASADGAESDEPEGPPKEPDELPAGVAQPSDASDPVNVDTPAFPVEGYRILDAVRLRIQTRFLPAAAFDGFDADLYQPSARLRFTAPLSKRAVLQFTGRFATSLYEIDGVTDFFGAGPGSGDAFDDFFKASLSLQTAVRLNEDRGLFFDDELWSVLGAVAGKSRWEAGAFGEGLTGGAAVALGYEIDGLIRVAVGVEVGSRIDRGGVRVSPLIDLRWNVTDDFTVRNRGTGLQLEYRLTPSFEVFAAGFSQGDRYRLDRRPGLPDDLTFRDRAVLAGAGFEWKIDRRFRLNVEAGAVAWRQLKVHSQDLGTISRERGNPSAYFDIRFEVRP